MNASIETYFVKTRNWHCRRWVKRFLDISHLWGVRRGDLYEDGDGKYILLTTSKRKAHLTWWYFMLFAEFSGGWTYLMPNFNSLAEKVQPYQRPNFLGTTPCGAGRKSLNRSMSENRGIALIFGVQGSEMTSSTQNGNTSWPSRSR